MLTATSAGESLATIAGSEWIEVADATSVDKPKKSIKCAGGCGKYSSSERQFRPCPFCGGSEKCAKHRRMYCSPACATSDWESHDADCILYTKIYYPKWTVEFALRRPLVSLALFYVPAENKFRFPRVGILKIVYPSADACKSMAEDLEMRHRIATKNIRPRYNGFAMSIISTLGRDALLEIASDLAKSIPTQEPPTAGDVSICRKIPGVDLNDMLRNRDGCVLLVSTMQRKYDPLIKDTRANASHIRVVPVNISPDISNLLE